MLLRRGLPAAQYFQHEIGETSKRRMEEARPAEAALQEDALAVREGLEAEFPVIGADAGRSDAAERQILRGEMKQRPVDGCAARDGPAQHLVPLRGVGAEIIKRERTRVSVDVSIASSRLR